MVKDIYKYIVIFSGLLLGCKDSQTNPDYTVLKGATIFDGTGRQYAQGLIIIKDGRIFDIGSGIEIPDGSNVIDVTGKFITPGLVDAHVHFFQTGFYDARPDGYNLQDSLPYPEVIAYQKSHLERYYETYLRSGITAVYDVGGFPWSLPLQESAENNVNAPHVAAAGPLITPFPEAYISILNTPDDQVLMHLDSEEKGRKIVRENSQAGATGIKIWGFMPGDTAFVKNIAAIADEIGRQGNKMIAHATTLNQAKLALKNQTRLLVHSVEDTLVDQEFVDLILKNNAIYTPTLIVRWGYYYTNEAMLGKTFEINDPNEVVDARTRSLLENAALFQKFISEDDLMRLKNNQDRYERLVRGMSVMLENIRIIHEQGVPIAVGTDAGNPGTLHGISIYDEMEAIQEAGIVADEIIKMATRNGALAMDRLDDFGTLEKEKMADLIILEHNPGQDIQNMRSITHVMRGGLLRSVKDKFE